MFVSLTNTVLRVCVLKTMRFIEDSALISSQPRRTDNERSRPQEKVKVLGQWNTCGGWLAITLVRELGKVALDWRLLVEDVRSPTQCFAMVLDAVGGERKAQRQHGTEVRTFAWQKGPSVVTVSAAPLGVLKKEELRTTTAASRFGRLCFARHLSFLSLAVIGAVFGATDSFFFARHLSFLSLAVTGALFGASGTCVARFFSRCVATLSLIGTGGRTPSLFRNLV